MGFPGYLTQSRHEIIIASASFLVFLTTIVQGICSSKKPFSRVHCAYFLVNLETEVGHFFRKFLEISKNFLKKWPTSVSKLTKK